jgi:ribosomal protein L37E
MGVPQQSQEHRHTIVTVHAVRRQAGVPYEVSRSTCSVCGRVLAERVLRRAAV